MTETMTKAEKIAQSGNIPSEWDESAEHVRQTCKQAFETLNTGKNADGDVIEPAAMEMLQHRAEHHGLHAYAYQTCDDGSVVALYANTKTANLKLAAFTDMESASRWSPRDER